jgi:hypothetical protein
VLVAGCGFFPSDDPQDVDCGDHDEDLDGALDDCDACPHLGDDQADGDGDGVGDACDPSPAVAGDRIALFDAFDGASLDGRWDQDGPASAIDGDAMTIVNTPPQTETRVSSAMVLDPYEVVAIVADIDIQATGDDGYYGIHWSRDVTSGYFCSIDRDPGTTHLVLQRLYANNPRETLSTMVVLPSGSGRFVAGDIAPAVGTRGIRCVTDFDPPGHSIVAAEPAPLPRTLLGVHARDATVAFRSIAVIASPAP